MAGRLPTVAIGNKVYFVDDRLMELRNVNNPHDVRPLTCRKCDDKSLCLYTGDPYNTDGDCLAMK